MCVTLTLATETAKVGHYFTFQTFSTMPLKP